MMRSQRFFASASLLLVCLAGYCCGPYWYLPQEYYMYRVWTGEKGTLESRNRAENINSWKALYPSVEEDQIAEVIYGWDLSSLMNLKDSKNAFAKAICKDPEAEEYLLTAKRCEKSCAERASKWYYPFKDDPDIAALDTVIQEAESNKEGRFYDRYLLQEIRAMFSLARYDEILSLWKSSGSGVQPGVIRDMIVGYVAGASYRTGDKEGAVEYYLSTEDIGSIRYCLAREGLSGDSLRFALLDMCALGCPDSPEIPSLLQETFYGYEDHWNDYDDYYRWTQLDYRQRMGVVRSDAALSRRYLDICQKAIARSATPAVWYYTAAYLTDLSGKPQQASSLLSNAEKSNRDADLGDFIKVFRIYLDAKLSTYDAGYENKLFSQLKWLDKKITGELNDVARGATAEFPYLMSSSQSYYYWNDMLRKIIIGEVGPRMEDAGKGVLALSLLNMADNRLVNYVDKRHVTWYTVVNDNYVAHSKTMSLSEYRKDTEVANEQDYSNYFFNAMDKVDVASLEGYAASMGRSESEFDKFLDARGYIDSDYINELIGTRYLRQQKYDKAVKWLSKVSDGYQKRTNVKWYMNRNPFVLESGRGYVSDSYKLSFAKEMLSLQGKVSSKDADIRGEALVRMGTGLRSSFTNCWALTQYHKYYEDEWTTSKQTLTAIEKADRMIAEGLKTIKDPEKAAAAYLSQHLYLSVAEKFPGTKICKKMKAECDKLYDHKKPMPVKAEL